jgi:hypothetical protein
MHNTLETFKTDLNNNLPRQVRSVVQQIQGEAQGKRLEGSPSTPHPGGGGGRLVRTIMGCLPT